MKKGYIDNQMFYGPRGSHRIYPDGCEGGKYGNRNRSSVGRGGVGRSGARRGRFCGNNGQGACTSVHRHSGGDGVSWSGRSNRLSENYQKDTNTSWNGSHSIRKPRGLKKPDDVFSSSTVSASNSKFVDLVFSQIIGKKDTIEHSKNTDLLNSWEDDQHHTEKSNQRENQTYCSDTVYSFNDNSVKNDRFSEELYGQDFDSSGNGCKNRTTTIMKQQMTESRQRNHLNWNDDHIQTTTLTKCNDVCESGDHCDSEPATKNVDKSLSTLQKLLFVMPPAESKEITTTSKTTVELNSAQDLTSSLPPSSTLPSLFALNKDTPLSPAATTTTTKPNQLNCKPSTPISQRLPSMPLPALLSSSTSTTTDKEVATSRATDQVNCNSTGADAVADGAALLKPTKEADKCGVLSKTLESLTNINERITSELFAITGKPALSATSEVTPDIDLHDIDLPAEQSSDVGTSSKSSKLSPSFQKTTLDNSSVSSTLSIPVIQSTITHVSATSLKDSSGKGSAERSHCRRQRNKESSMKPPSKDSLMAFMQKYQDCAKTVALLERDIERLRHEVSVGDDHSREAKVDLFRVEAELNTAQASLKRAAHDVERFMTERRSSPSTAVSNSGTSLAAEKQMDEGREKAAPYESKTPCKWLEFRQLWSIQHHREQTSRDYVSCEYRDLGQHWCQLCNYTSRNLHEHLRHLHHEDHWKLFETEPKPWFLPRSSFGLVNARPIKMGPMKGVELIVPAKCYMCSICKDLFMELYEIVDHLNSKEHHNQYRDFIGKNPHYERSYSMDKLAGMQRQRMKCQQKSAEAHCEGNRIWENEAEHWRDCHHGSSWDNDRARFQRSLEERHRRRERDNYDRKKELDHKASYSAEGSWKKETDSVDYKRGSRGFYDDEKRMPHDDILEKERLYGSNKSSHPNKNVAQSHTPSEPLKMRSFKKAPGVVVAKGLKQERQGAAHESLNKNKTTANLKEGSHHYAFFGSDAAAAVAVASKSSNESQYGIDDAISKTSRRLKVASDSEDGDGETTRDLAYGVGHDENSRHVSEVTAKESKYQKHSAEVLKKHKEVTRHSAETGTAAASSKLKSDNTEMLKTRKMDGFFESNKMDTIRNTGRKRKESESGHKSDKTVKKQKDNNEKNAVHGGGATDCFETGSASQSKLVTVASRSNSGKRVESSSSESGKTTLQKESDDAKVVKKRKGSTEICKDVHLTSVGSSLKSKSPKVEKVKKQKLDCHLEVGDNMLWKNVDAMEKMEGMKVLEDDDSGNHFFGFVDNTDELKKKKRKKEERSKKSASVRSQDVNFNDFLREIGHNSKDSMSGIQISSVLSVPDLPAEYNKCYVTLDRIPFRLRKGSCMVRNAENLVKRITQGRVKKDKKNKESFDRSEASQADGSPIVGLTENTKFADTSTSCHNVEEVENTKFAGTSTFCHNVEEVENTKFADTSTSCHNVEEVENTKFAGTSTFCHNIEEVENTKFADTSTSCHNVEEVENTKFADTSTSCHNVEEVENTKFADTSTSCHNIEEVENTKFADTSTSCHNVEEVENTKSVEPLFPCWNVRQAQSVDDILNVTFDSETLVPEADIAQAIDILEDIQPFDDIFL